MPNDAPNTPSAAAPWTVHLGSGALEKLPACLDQLAADRLLIVRDRLAARLSGADERLAPLLERRDCHFEDGFGALPLDTDAQRVAGAALACRAQVVVGLGGGVALDVAKLAAVLAGTGLDVAAALAARPEATSGALPVIAVPTTAGTGAECTSTAVVYVDGHKRSVEGPGVRPRVALVDPSLCASLPPGQTAATGLDALCQAMESHWSVGATDASRRDTLDALALLVPNLLPAVRRPSAESRHAMSHGAYLAGRAIDVTRTTAPHALSYRLTQAFGLAHGAAVALFVPPVVRHLAGLGAADCRHPGGVARVRERLDEIAAAFGVEGTDALATAIEELVAACGLPTRLRQAGVQTATERDELAILVNPQRLANHPQQLDADALRRIVESVA